MSQEILILPNWFSQIKTMYWVDTLSCKFITSYNIANLMAVIYFNIAPCSGFPWCNGYYLPLSLFCGKNFLQNFNNVCVFVRILCYSRRALLTEVYRFKTPAPLPSGNSKLGSYLSFKGLAFKFISLPLVF